MHVRCVYISPQRVNVFAGLQVTAMFQWPVASCMCVLLAFTILCRVTARSVSCLLILITVLGYMTATADCSLVVIRCGYSNF